MTDEYDVGYKKPPKNKQFKKGESGNKKGRPKGSKNLITIAKEELEQKITLKENNTTTEVTKQTAIMKRIISMAIGGDIKYLTLLVRILQPTSVMQEEVLEQEELIDDEAFKELLDGFVKSKGHLVQNESEEGLC